MDAVTRARTSPVEDFHGLYRALFPSSASHVNGCWGEWKFARQALKDGQGYACQASCRPFYLSLFAAWVLPLQWRDHAAHVGRTRGALWVCVFDKETDSSNDHRVAPENRKFGAILLQSIRAVPPPPSFANSFCT